MELLNSVLSSDKDEEEGGDKWIFYHLPIKCRGNFVRLVLEECGVDYIDAYGFDIMKQVALSPRLRSRPSIGPHNKAIMEQKQIPADKNILNLKRVDYPYGSPFLVNFDNPSVCLSQSPVIVQYLSRRYGLRPKSDIDHSRAGMIVSNCNDFFSAIYMKSHALKPMPSDAEYLKQMLAFLNTECAIWLEILSKPLGERLYYFNGRITQCDLALYNIMDCLYEIFSDDEDMMSRFVWRLFPNLHAHYKNIVHVSKAIKPLMQRQKEHGITWWPLFPHDFLGICRLRTALRKYAKSKL